MANSGHVRVDFLGALASQRALILDDKMYLIPKGEDTLKAYDLRFGGNLVFKEILTGGVKAVTSYFERIVFLGVDSNVYMRLPKSARKGEWAQIASGVVKVVSDEQTKLLYVLLKNGEIKVSTDTLIGDVDTQSNLRWNSFWWAKKFFREMGFHGVSAIEAGHIRKDGTVSEINVVFENGKRQTLVASTEECIDLLVQALK